MKSKRFRVWFEQINETYYDVMAIDKEQAIRYAKGKWKQNTQLIVSHISNGSKRKKWVQDLK